MTKPFRLIDEPDVEPAPLTQDAPHVFTRTVSAPAGMPWDQARAAKLEARHGAPLPPTEAVHQIKRLDRWSPGRAARFAVFYVRAEAIGERLTAKATIDGQTHVLEFLSSSAQRQRLKRFLVTAGAAGGLALVLGMSILTVVSVRTETATELAAAEQLAASKLNQARHIQRQKDLTRSLDSLGFRGKSLEAVLSDLAWASSGKAPETKILSVHWERGLMAFQVKGQAAPFTRTDRPLRKADGQLPGGVSLWGVGPASPQSGLRNYGSAVGAQP